MPKKVFRVEMQVVATTFVYVEADVDSAAFAVADELYGGTDLVPCHECAHLVNGGRLVVVESCEDCPEEVTDPRELEEAREWIRAQLGEEGDDVQG